jgi:hypothetical protein
MASYGKNKEPWRGSSKVLGSKIERVMIWDGKPTCTCGS